MPRPSEAGKGPDRRPAQVSEETVALNWAIAFPPKKKDRTYTTRGAPRRSESMEKPDADDPT